MPHPWDVNWSIGDRLGKGGQGLTHLATKKDESGLIGAIKTLKNSKDVQARGRMHREVASLKVLSSAGGAVPHVLDHNTEEYEDSSRELFVVMEHVPGDTLREAVTKNGPFSIGEATQLIRGLCTTVELAHSYPILHRDLKPENIILRKGKLDQLVIVDYGLSFNAEDPDVTVTDETFRNRFLDLPETNTPGGNLRDPRSDITAVCAVYFYMLTGHVPGQLQSGDGLLPHMRKGYSLKDSLPAEAPIGLLATLFNRAFAPNVDNRFQRISEFVDRLEPVTAGADVAKPEDPIAVAERASIALRQRDRTTQVREFMEIARKQMQSVRGFIQRFEGKLGRFVLDIGENEGRLGKELPKGLDRVHPYQLRLQVNPLHHNKMRILVLTVASQGEQSVFLRQTYSRETAENKYKLNSDWKELLWYDATERTPDLSPVFSEIQTWMNEAIEGLTEEVLSQ